MMTPFQLYWTSYFTSTILSLFFFSSKILLTWRDITKIEITLSAGKPGEVQGAQRDNLQQNFIELRNLQLREGKSTGKHSQKYPIITSD